MIYIVLGMHKSGTTLVSEILQASGIDMGCANDGRNYDEGNKAERDEVLSWNKRVLGERMHSLDCIRVPLHAEAKRRSLIAEAGELVRNLDAHGGDWGFKDPRTCLTLGWWGEVFPTQPRLVLIYRDPGAVCRHYLPRPILKRWALTPWINWSALRAWWIYNRAALDLVRNAQGRSLVLNYERMMKEGGEFTKLAAFCGRKLNDVRKPLLQRVPACKGGWFRLAAFMNRLAGRDIDQLWLELEAAGGSSMGEVRQGPESPTPSSGQTGSQE